GVCRRSHDGSVELLDTDGWLDTGDLGHLRDGRLVLVGRIDHVINRGGEQVSPLAVEQALVGHADVAEALVTGVAAGRGSTVAALVTAADGRSPAPGDLQDWLAPRLSPNQRPSVIRVVEALPRDGKGAPDRRAAARLLTERAEVPSTGPEAPASSAEVSALWQALLGVDGTGFGPDDDFFAVGGDSLLALELAERLSELSGAEVAPGLALRLRTVAEQAAWLDRQRTEGARPEEAVVRHAGPGDGPTVVLLPGSGGTATGTRPIADAIHRRLPRAHVVTVEIPVRHGAPLLGVDEIADAAVASLAAAGQHPSVVVGVSFGSLVAVEVVRRLGTGADGIAQVVLVDLPRVQPPATGTSRARTAARILWSGRGVLPLRRLGTLLRPVRPLGEGALPEVPAGWRTVARRRAELARTSSTSPIRGGPSFVVVATLRQVRRTRDATLGWRGTLRPLGVRLAVSNHERLLTVDAHLVAEAVDADALGTR
ncbi:MAG TPA: phosphopantetheine-binding protein, partial [Acidimicrobiales bacterium]|nr:phosphopantetheine-binding protein [Acidimicrobiales bacterium]